MVEKDEKKIAIAIIGGTGALGSALAMRWLLAGYKIIIGSRNQEKADDLASKLANQLNRHEITVETNAKASAIADIVVLAVPYSAHSDTLKDIATSVQGKIVIETTVPLRPPKVARVSLPKRGCVAAVTQEFLGDHADVVSTLHTVSATHLGDFEHELFGDVLVYGNKKSSRQIAINLIEDIGLKGWHGGSIENSAASEAMTSVMIFMNKYYSLKGAGIQVISEGQKD